MSIFTQNDGADQLDDFRTREKFICSLCGYEFSAEKYLRNHFKHCQDVKNPADRLGAGLVSVKSEDCIKELKHCLEFEEHVTNKETFDTNVEDAIFTEYKISGFHCKVSDPPMEQPEVLCEYSDGGYKAQSVELEEHLKIQRRENPCGCNVCDFVTTKSRHLNARTKRHKFNTWDTSNKNLVSRNSCRRMNTKNKPFKSSRCDHAGATRSDLTNHTRTRKGEKPFKCTRCDYACAQSGNLTSHMRTHTGYKPFKCTRCTYASGIREHLARHMRTHTGEKPFNCTVCDYACAAHSHLIYHMRTHTGEKPFKCTRCDYACTQPGSLRSHMSTHTGEKPFKCTICNYASVKRAHLTQHMRRHTGEKCNA